jgi:DNA-binding MarR family transcriptional regulator
MSASREIEILNLVNEIMQHATASMQRSLREAELGLAAMEARTLRFVARNPGCTQNDIVRASGRDKAQIARIIKTLLERGNVSRMPNEAGEKRQRLVLTADGAHAHERAEALREVVAQSLVHELDAGEREQLESLLRRMPRDRAGGSD